MLKPYQKLLDEITNQAIHSLMLHSTVIFNGKLDIIDNEKIFNRPTRKLMPKVWSRKGRCPSCGVITGSNHSKNCKFKY